MEFSAQGHTLTTINLCKWLVGNYHPLYEKVMEFIYIKNLWNKVADPSDPLGPLASDPVHLPSVPTLMCTHNYTTSTVGLVSD